MVEEHLDVLVEELGQEGFRGDALVALVKTS